MPVPLVSLLPDPPLPTDPEQVFDNKVGASLLAQQAMVPEMNTQAEFTNQRAIDADASATAAAASTVSASDSATAAQQQVALAADQVTLAEGHASQAGQYKTSAEVAAAAAASAAGLPTLVGAAGRALVVSADELTVEWGDVTPPLVQKPAALSPAAGTTGLESAAFSLTLYYSLYGKAQSSIQIQVGKTADFSELWWDSGVVAPASGVSIPSFSGVIPESTQVWWRGRYGDIDGAVSDWSQPAAFTTAAVYNSYIPTPTATPAAFGDPLDGGFYAGMTWGQIAQSSSSKVLATGSQSFTVPDMTGAPIVYEGQLLEVRNRANPANKFIGTVTGATGTTLTMNVTSIGGSGTFSDWSVMARHRVIVAPKASGENAGIALKNANTALPTACQTLTEGWAATEAMRNADTSTVYPAAHWARNLNISGCTDWYIPARDELELCWRNLKPVTNNNYVTADRPTGQTFNYANNGSVGDTSASHGVNNNSSPTGAAYTTTNPAQTAATAFRSGGAEAFEFGSAYYWSCSEYSATNAWLQFWSSSSPGNQSNGGKANTYRVRAVRRSII